MTDEQHEYFCEWYTENPNATLDDIQQHFHISLGEVITLVGDLKRCFAQIDLEEELALRRRVSYTMRIKP